MDDLQSRYDTVSVDGNRVRELRKSLRLTQQGLATATGRSRGWISVIEGRHEVSVSRQTAQRLANALSVDVLDLLVPPRPASQRQNETEAAVDVPAGDFTFGTPTPVSRTEQEEFAELEAVQSDLQVLARRIERILRERRRRR